MSLPKTPRCGADILVESLIRHGVEVVFAYPGGTSMSIHQALTRVTDRVRTVLPRQEQGGGFAASAYARFSGKVGVCTATSGPGATNLVPCLADAQRYAVPLIAVTGQVNSKVIGTDAFQEIPIVQMSRPITKHHYLVTQVEELTRVFKEAFLLATTGRPGPVIIDVPKDIQNAQTVPDWDAAVQLRSYQATPVEKAPEETPECQDEGLPELLPHTLPTPAYVLRQLWEIVHDRRQFDQTVLTTGVGPEQAWLQQNYRLPSSRHWITTDSISADGYALPAALGVLMAQHAGPVVAVATPDNFLVNIQELGCAFCENIPAKVLLLTPRSQANRFDFVTLTRGFLGQGQRVHQVRQTAAAVADMLDSDEPYVLEVIVAEEASQDSKTASQFGLIAAS